jgi:hypothetical protein
MLGAGKGKGDSVEVLGFLCQIWASSAVASRPAANPFFRGAGSILLPWAMGQRGGIFKTINQQKKKKQLPNSSQTSSLLKMRKKRIKDCFRTLVFKSSTIKLLYN